MKTASTKRFHREALPIFIGNTPEPSAPIPEKPTTLSKKDLEKIRELVRKYRELKKETEEKK
ncbi:hypothetical protein K8Q93_01120 [Candidatus Parcubacteria bacterium]|nr:hypothetical protein [Candidatus Parcubacteria bacterium]